MTSMNLSFQFEGTFVIADDIMDGNVTRHEKPCWNKLDNVGMMAVNDLMMIDNSCNYLLRKYFGKTEFYDQLQEMYLDNKFGAFFGQFQDMMATKSDITHFDMPTYEQMAINKMGYAGIYLPMCMAMIMNGYRDVKLNENVKDIVLTLAPFYQSLYDFYDCFGGYFLRLEEIGTDIQERKLTCLIVKAMELGSEDQKLILRNIYGRADHVDAVKEIYRDLKLPSHLMQYAQSKIDEVHKKVQFVSDDKVKSFLQNVLIRDANQEVSNLAAAMR